MSGRLNIDVEILKLARLTGSEPAELGYLERVEPEDVRDLREQVTGVLFDADRHMLQRVAAATKLLPSKLTATIGESVFGPLLCARLTGVLDPHRAVEIAARLPSSFLADVAEHLDPRRASRVIAGLPPEQVAEIAKELVAREQYITMGNVVGHLSKDATRAALAVVDDEALLRTAYVVESKGSLGSLVALLSEKRLEGLICTASDADLWPEALDVMGHVSERQRGELADIAAAQDDEVLEGLLRAAECHGLWGVLLPITRAMSPASRERFVGMSSIQTRTVLATILEAAATESLWADLLVFLPLLPAPGQRRIAELIASGDEPVLAGLLAGVEQAELERESLTLIGRLAPAKQRSLAKRIVSLASARGLASLAGAAEEAELDVLRDALNKPPRRRRAAA